MKEQKEYPKIEFANLPPVGELEDARTRQRVAALLELLDQAVSERLKLEASEEEHKAELEKLQLALALPGFRFGALCFTSQPVKGRRSLDPMLLMENGVSAKTIQASYKEGAPGTRRNFKRLGEADA